MFPNAVSNQAYAQTMKQACKGLRIPSKHYILFGRSAGSVLGELNELDGYNINDLGNWNEDTRRDVSSAKLPVKAMRVMAGHHEAKGTVYLPRCNVIPISSLQSKIFPFVDQALHLIAESTATTATGFLKFLLHLRVVILQDVAAVLLAGRTYLLFE